MMKTQQITKFGVLPHVRTVAMGAVILALCGQIATAQDVFGTPLDDFGPQEPAASDTTPSVLTLCRQSPAEQHIMKALCEETKFDFFDDSLADALSYLGQAHNLQIAVDQPALDEIGVTADATVNAQFSGIALRSGLSLVLRPLGLTYMIRDEVLTITTPQAAEQQTTLRLYPFHSACPMTLEQLAEAIRGGIAPSSWDTVGGNGFLMAYKSGLMVNQTQAVHEQIVELLELLNKQK